VTSEPDDPVALGCSVLIGIGLILLGAYSLDVHEWFFGTAAVAIGIVWSALAWRTQK
jgi:hypothetical protein